MFYFTTLCKTSRLQTILLVKTVHNQGGFQLFCMLIQSIFYEMQIITTYCTVLILVVYLEMFYY